MEYFIALIYIYLNLNSSFSELYGSPITLNIMLYVTTVNNSYQPLHIFCHKELHFRGHIGLDLNIVTWFKKIPPSSPYDQVQPWKIWKTHAPRYALKIHFQMFFALRFLNLVFRIKFFEFNIKWTKWRCQLIDTDCDFVKKFCLVYLVKVHNHWILSNAT